MADEDIVYLSEGEGKKLKNFINKEIRVRKEKPQYRKDDQLIPVDVLIARIPLSGILGVVDSVISSAECQIYSIDGILDDPKLLTLLTFTEEVFNITSCDIPGDAFVPILKERGGSWIVSGNQVAICPQITTGTSTSTSTSTSGLTGTSPGTSTSTSTSTSTATSTSTDCTPILFYEEDSRCENGYLNVYKRSITLNIVNGCLTKSTGSWIFDHNAGYCDQGVTNNTTIIVNVTNITELTDVIENTIYFNTYNNTINILINNTWYTYCTCEITPGTGTGTSGMYYWCMSEPGTSTDTTFEDITDCSFCPTGVRDHLTFKIISGCNVATQSQPMVYNATGPNGAGWYTPTDDIDGLLQYWFMFCEHSAPDAVRVAQFVDGENVGGGVAFPIASCSPFDTGEFGAICNSPCEEFNVIMQVVEE